MFSGRRKRDTEAISRSAWRAILSAATADSSTRAALRCVVSSMVKRSPPLERVVNLVNRLTLDQTYYTLRKAGLVVTGQNGLSVVAGATDTYIVVLGTSVDWSKRAIYRHESPHYKVTYVKGTCEVYCARDKDCPVPEHKGELRCVPGYEAVRDAVLAKLPQAAAPR